MSKLKVGIFTKYTKYSGSSNFRVYIYQKDFDKLFDTMYFSFWNEQYDKVYINNKRKYFLNIVFLYVLSSVKRYLQLKRACKVCDVIFIQKCLFPGMRFVPKRMLSNFSGKIIFDVDDAVYLNKCDSSSEVARLSNVTIVGNNKLESFYNKFAKCVVIVPTIDYSPAYLPFHRYTFNEHVIGWIGSGGSINNLDLIVEPLNELIQRHPEVRFVYICDQDYGYTKKIRNSFFVKWEKEEYVRQMEYFTIGVMPLNKNDFNEGKCGFKIIQYLNMGKPFVATPLGVNNELINGYGLGADSSMEWIDKMETLLFNKDKYDELVKEISQSFQQKFGYEKNRDRLTSIMRS